MTQHDFRVVAISQANSGRYGHPVELRKERARKETIIVDVFVLFLFCQFSVVGSFLLKMSAAKLDVETDGVSVHVHFSCNTNCGFESVVIGVVARN